ncbi:MAG: carbohydrate-binding protein [Fibrobacter sp.]|nr:carbohydrate-binding protein [Fibrobacter sp.]
MQKKLFFAVLLFIFAFNTFAELKSCEFGFGTDWDFVNTNKNASAVQSADYITIWLNDPSFNQYWHGDMAKFCKDNNKTAVFYAYIIAKASGLGDGDVGGRLTTEGAGWLKSNFNTVKSRYENYAQGIASKYGTDKPCIFLMEPDYYQYFSGNQNVKLSFSDASSYMNEMIACVKKHLPKALFSLDISPWNNNQEAYIKSFDLTKFTFMHTSGGRTEAGNARIRMDNSNNVTWAGVVSASGKPIIADDGYGVGGGSTGHDPTWDDVNNLKARIADGVCAITQKSPNANWGSTINNLKSSLASQDVKCYGSSEPSGFTLTITNATGGTVTASPQKTSYSSGEQVTLTATPQSGYAFDKWSGDASGTNATVSITMNANKNVTPAFKQIPTNEFTLTIQVTGSGTVTKNPDQATYTKGTVVNLTANPAAGRSKFSSWSGGASGTSSTVSVTMNSNQTVTATFTDTAKVDSLKVEAESFTSKNGANLVVENNGSYSNIGYIESGYSTTYQVSVPKSGEYTFKFRVATGVDNASFGVSVGGNNVGTVTFPNTGDWQQYAMHNLSQAVELKAGQTTIALNYNGALNVDYFVLTFSGTPVEKRTERAVISGIKVNSTKNGFETVLPVSHGFKSYSLVNLNGRSIQSGKISPQTRTLSFSNSNREIVFLRFEGDKGTQVISRALMR